MNRHSKYTRKINRTRDCTKCKHFAGFIGHNYFVCTAEMYEDQEEPKCHDIYDRDVLKKGACSLFTPTEGSDLDDMVRFNIAMECGSKKNDQSLFDEE